MSDIPVQSDANHVSDLNDVVELVAYLDAYNLEIAIAMMIASVVHHQHQNLVGL